MYSRFPRNASRPVQLPEHYSGCAFSELDEKEVATPTPPPHTSQPQPRQESTHSPHEPLSLFGKPLSLSIPGLDFEELLLIGLILLLARSEQENDLILWLALLLFCK